MTALDRKLWRDLRLMWSQALTIALVVASGIAGFITSLSAVDSLAAAREDYYAAGRFADVFARVKRAPRALETVLRAIPGVADVQTSVRTHVRIDLPGLPDPITGLVIGVPRDAPARLNRLELASGRAIDPHRGDGGELEALVSRGFARSRGLALGDHLNALINGKVRRLRMVGAGLSPEFIFASAFGAPDIRGFGVFWVDHDALAAALDLEGAFTDVAVKLAPGASTPAVIEAMKAALGPYGGRDAHAREHQPSHVMLDNEIKEQRVLGTVMPAIFLGVAVFLINVVVTRLVQTQREQIATLKAVGYPNAAIGLHYLKLVLVIMAMGLVLGLALGARLGEGFTGLYADFFHFPRFDYRLDPGLALGAVAICVITAVAGLAHALSATMRLAPAEAMRPPAPGRYRPTLIERLGWRRLSPVLRMTLRNIERRPWRSALAVAGVAAAVAITVMGNFTRDAIDYIVDSQFNVGIRGDVSVWMAEPVDDRSGAQALRQLPGVVAVESTRSVPVEIGFGARRERVQIDSRAGRASLFRVIDVDNRETLLEGRGLVLSDRLADKLGARPGDRLQVQILTGEPRTIEMTLGGVVRDMMGLNAHMDREALNQALGDGDWSSGWMMDVLPGAEPRTLEAIKQLPRVAGAFSKSTMLRNMEEISARNVRLMSLLLTSFAAVIAVGVVYNNARIALAERAWELASLRVLGFTRAEVSAMLLGEMALLIALALPLGMLAGWGLVHLIVELLKSDQFFFPVAIAPRTYAWAAVAVLAAAVASALVVRRRIDTLDLVAVLKTRE
jgi:putative ABC transport system permease protein